MRYERLGSVSPGFTNSLTRYTWSILIDPKLQILGIWKASLTHGGYINQDNKIVIDFLATFFSSDIQRFLLELDIPVPVLHFQSSCNSSMVDTLRVRRNA